MAQSAETSGKAVGIWVRVSTEDQARGESPEHHERRARAFCEARDWRVVEFYSLEAVSGKSVVAHPEAQRMLADIRSGRITGLVFSKLARLARNTKELLDFSEIFRACGADLVSLQESIDTSSPAGRLYFTMVAAMAQWEREEIADRVAASVPIRAKLGKQTGGAAPFGYRWREGRLEPDPAEAPVRVLMYELYAEHRRKKTVARLLNERGYRTRAGGLWSDTSVLRLLQDTTAKGIHLANYTSTTDRHKAWVLKPESEWVRREVPAIVSAELWDDCNRDIIRPARPKARKSRHLFAGFAYCECGEKMYVWSNSPKYRCGACNNKIPVGDLEAVYREQLRNFVVSPDEIRAHNAAAQEAIREKAALVESGTAELRKIEAEAERLYQLYLADKLSMDDFGRRHDPLTARRKQLEAELPRLEAQADVLRLNLLSREEALEEARDLTSRWGELPFEERRQIVETITDRIIIGKEDVEISLLHIPFGSSADRATRPCRCGHGGAGRGWCGKAPKCQMDYQNRISGPLLDRIDLQVDVPPVTAADLALPPPAEGSAEAAARVAAARDEQTARAGAAGRPDQTLNARIDGALLDKIATPDDGGRALMTRAAEGGMLSARGWTRVLRLARTIADLDGSDAVRRRHVAESLIYRRTPSETVKLDGSKPDDPIREAAIRPYASG